MNIGLFFGTFNPIHNGHLAIAKYMLKTTAIEEVWFVVSPHNPLKEKNKLLNEKVRLRLVKMAVKDLAGMKVCDAEFHLPQPSYTINTLKFLKQKFPEHIFSLIIGSDNLVSLPKWKNYKTILRRHHIYVYRRSKKIKSPLLYGHHVFLTYSPLMQVSSTEVRKRIREGKSVKKFLPEKIRMEVEKKKYFLK